jgi:hypothetical protein
VGKGEGEARANRPLMAAVRNVPFIEVRCMLRFVDVWSVVVANTTWLKRCSEQAEEAMSGYVSKLAHIVN